MLELTERDLADEIGSRLAKIRLSRNIKQDTLAASAGVSVRTLRRIEAGRPTTFDNFLRVARALELDDHLLTAIPSHDIRPIERVDSRRGTERQRARPKKPAPRQGRPDRGFWGDDR